MFNLHKCGKAYNDKSRSLIFNLSDTRNPEPFLALVTRKVTPEDFVSLDPKQLASSKMKKEREASVMKGLWNKRTDWDKELVKNDEKYKGMFKCEECDSDRTGFI